MDFDLLHEPEPGKVNSVKEIPPAFRQKMRKQYVQALIPYVPLFQEEADAIIDNTLGLVFQKSLQCYQNATTQQRPSAELLPEIAQCVVRPILEDSSVGPAHLGLAMQTPANQPESFANYAPASSEPTGSTFAQTATDFDPILNFDEVSFEDLIPSCKTSSEPTGRIPQAEQPGKAAEVGEIDSGPSLFEDERSPAGDVENAAASCGTDRRPRNPFGTKWGELYGGHAAVIG